MRRLMILVVVLVVLTAYASAQDLYKCKTPDGRTVISNAPCAGGSNETVIPSAVSSPSVTPSPSAVSSPQPATDNPTVDAAFKALRKISAATEVGINMRDYGQLVVEAKAVVNDITINTSTNKDTVIQKELEAAMQSYVDALTVWNLSIPANGLLIVSQPEGRRLHNTYHFALGGIDWTGKELALSTIWAVATTHLMRATELAK